MAGQVFVVFGDVDLGYLYTGAVNGLDGHSLSSKHSLIAASELFTMRFASMAALSVVGAVIASPAAISPREDWKIALGWDGKTTTPAEIDPSNVVKPTPGVSTYCSCGFEFNRSSLSTETCPSSALWWCLLLRGNQLGHTLRKEHYVITSNH